MLSHILFSTLCHVLHTLAVPSARASGPTVQLDDASFVGVASGSVSKFLGIPFAQPPIGDRRFRLPEPIGSYSGTQMATDFGPACPQQAVTVPIPPGAPQNVADYLLDTAYHAALPDNEDCLTINVVKPASATPDSKLPVVAWIFGGGFEFGSPSLYDGGVIVSRSITLDKPVIYVSMNYRASAFGFLASQEVKDAGVGNLGLQDQREALRWIQKYIGAFGGDPTKVTIWGQSAGAISASLQMVTNGGDVQGLFRAAFLESGSPIPVGDITHGQKSYDAIVDETGCSDSADTLQCLRTADYGVLKAAVDKSPFMSSYQSLNLAWMPRVDGVFLTDAPQQLVLDGSVANIPFITGDCDDEGTIFSLGNTNVTTDEEFVKYMSTIYLPTASNDDIQELATLYPSDITQGSPYDTGFLNAITPQFKRLASFQGDAVFQAPRRLFLQQRSDKQNTWSFLSKRLKSSFSIIGSAHTSDILNVYSGGEMSDFLINFVVDLDPNGDQGMLFWPKYSNSAPQLLTFQDGIIPLSITPDTYRMDAMAYVSKVFLQNPL